MKLKFKTLKEIIKSISSKSFLQLSNELLNLEDISLSEFKSHAYTDGVHYCPKARIIITAENFKSIPKYFNSKLIF